MKKKHLTAHETIHEENTHLHNTIFTQLGERRRRRKKETKFKYSYTISVIFMRHCGFLFSVYLA